MAKRKPSATQRESTSARTAEVEVVLKQIVQKTDDFCLTHLDEEYAGLCRILAVNLSEEEGAPLLRGKLEGWAAGIIYTVGWVNFLSDPEQKPYMRTTDLYKLVGVSEATTQARSSTIRKLYDLMAMDPRLCRRSILDENPLVWMVQLENGMIDDARRYPRAIQEELVEAGVLPYVHPTASDEAS